MRAEERKTKKIQTKRVQFSEKQLMKDLRQEARVLNIHLGAAELIAERVSKAIQEWTKDTSTITQSDLDRRVILEVKKYNKDLAFILSERNKLI